MYKRISVKISKLLGKRYLEKRIFGKKVPLKKRPLEKLSIGKRGLGKLYPYPLSLSDTSEAMGLNLVMPKLNLAFL